MQPIHCSGAGPHDPTDGILGEADRNVDGMLCPPCAQRATDDVPDQTSLVTVQVDPNAVTAALTAAQKSTTVAGLRAAVIALAQQIQPS